MLKAPALLATLALALPALGEPVENAAPAPEPTPERTPEQVQAEAAQIMAAAEEQAAAPLAPSPTDAQAVPLAIASVGGAPEHLGFISARRPTLRLPAWVLNAPALTGLIDSAEHPDHSIVAMDANDPLSFSNEGLGWFIIGTNTKLMVHAAYIRGAAGDSNSRTPVPTVTEPFDLNPSAARRQFVLTLQAQFVF